MDNAKVASILLIIILYLIPTQDLAASFLFFLGFPVLVIKTIILLKEILVIGGGLYLLLNSKFSFGRKTLFVLLLYASIFILVSPLPFLDALVGYRTYLILFFGFVIGENIGTQACHQTFIFTHINYALIFILFFGVLEYYILPEEIWLSPFPIIEMKKSILGLTGIVEFYDTGMSANALGEVGKRVLGPFNEPLYMAYYTVILLNFIICNYIYQKSRNAILILFGTVIIFLTQTRAIILGLILSYFYLLFQKQYIKYILYAFVLFFVVVIIFFDWFQTMALSVVTFDGRTYGHVMAYVEGLITVTKHPFGAGVGTANTVLSYGENFQLEIFHTENAFINTAIELGILGFLLLLFTFFYLFRKFHKYMRTVKTFSDNYFIVASGYVLMFQFIFAGFLAPHILTGRILIPFMIVTGWAYSIVNSKEQGPPNKVEYRAQQLMNGNKNTNEFLTNRIFISLLGLIPRRLRRDVIPACFWRESILWMPDRNIRA